MLILNPGASVYCITL